MDLRVFYKNKFREAVQMVNVTRKYLVLRIFYKNKLREAVQTVNVYIKK